jgi:hypothetical protein
VTWAAWARAYHAVRDDPRRCVVGNPQKFFKKNVLGEGILERDQQKWNPVLRPIAL